MKTFDSRLAAGACAFVCLASLALAKPLSDLDSPEKRRVTVELAQHLTRVPEAAPIPADLANLFNPEGFDQADPEEAKAVAEALAKSGRSQNTGGSPSTSGGRPSVGGSTASANQPARPPGDREILEILAARLPSASTISFGGETILVLGRNRVKIGDKFTIMFNGQDYDLELVAIDRTTFTLRYHNEEFIRPTKNGK